MSNSKVATAILLRQPVTALARINFSGFLAAMSAAFRAAGWMLAELAKFWDQAFQLFKHASLVSAMRR
jgi:hypothetical protein